MNIFINIILFSLVISQKPKLCINCKHYTKHSLVGSEFGECRLFKTTVGEDNFLVNGIKGKTKNYFCSIARKYEDMCGQEGKHYESNTK